MICCFGRFKDLFSFAAAVFSVIKVQLSHRRNRIFFDVLQQNTLCFKLAIDNTITIEPII